MFITGPVGSPQLGKQGLTSIFCLLDEIKWVRLALDSNACIFFLFRSVVLEKLRQFFSCYNDY